MDTSIDYPESPMDPEDLDATPCKGCGQILEEGKAFELAGHRWHIDCFRCNSCQTLLDSDANLLLLGDGSLICNNCTYSCSACGNKIEDLAILTGDHAYCAGCFKCRNCKKRIENLRYARTSQGMFCMDCHDALMARRRKKSGKTSSRKQHLDKSLPSLPPTLLPSSTFSPESTPGLPPSGDTPVELPGSLASTRMNSSRTDQRDGSPADSDRAIRGNQSLSSTYRQDSASRNASRFETPMDDFIPMALDPVIATGPSPMLGDASHANGKTPTAIPKQEPVELSTDYFNVKEKSSKRRAPGNDVSGSQPNSPAIVLNKENDQDLRRKASASAATVLDTVTRDTPQQPLRSNSEHDKFKLQEAPKRRKSSGQQYTGPGSKEDFPILSLDSSPIDLSLKSQFSPTNGPLREQHINITHSDSGRSSQTDTPTQKTPLTAQEPRSGENNLEIPNLPKRGDSLQKLPIVQRKEVPNSRSASHDASHDNASPLPPRSYETSSSMNGGLVISRPMESPISKSALTMTDVSGDDSANGDSFVSPRAAPPRPAGDANRHKTKGSVSTIRSETRNGEPGSPGLNRYQNSDIDEGQRTGEDGPGFFQRTFSKSARHARSHSDRGSRNSLDHKWSKSGLNGTGIMDRDMGSPTMSSPDSKGGEFSQVNQEISKLRNENYLERQRAQELEARVAELESTLDSKNSISKVNSELREKRSTIVVLDTQKEIVIRELEVITEHLQQAKQSDRKFDLGQMQGKVLADFVGELNKLKDSYTPQIEELIQQRAEIQDELAQVLQKRERAFKEFEQLSGKNAQLAELNNQLVGTIQELQHKVNPHENKNVPPGLGIYNHHKERSNLSIDSRDIGSSIGESQYTGTTMLDQGPDSATILGAPQVVNIQKGQVTKRSYWKKGGGTVAKGMKGLKGAFSSTEPKTGREGSVGGLTEGIPYGQMGSGGEPMPVTTLPGGKISEDNRQGFGFFGQQKGKPGMGKPSIREPFSNVPVAEPSFIFGSELEMRAAYEGVTIPYIVTRCIQEVELRGMFSEGIYRKSGSKTQTDTVKEMFQRGDESEISDPDFDINAVASCLKQYFRNLPTPLLTFDLYDRLLDATKLPERECIVAVRNCIIDLPARHRDTVEFLIFHLARVVKLQETNLMTSLNCGVVFAPTIMMGEDPREDLQNTQQKNWLITFLIDNCQEIFLHSGENMG